MKMKTQLICGIGLWTAGYAIVIGNAIASGCGAMDVLELMGYFNKLAVLAGLWCVAGVYVADQICRIANGFICFILLWLAAVAWQLLLIAVAYNKGVVVYYWAQSIGFSLPSTLVVALVTAIVVCGGLLLGRVFAKQMQMRARSFNGSGYGWVSEYHD